MESRTDGTLMDWSAISKTHRWHALLLGNGLSIHVWGGFAYRSLFEEAKKRHLSVADQKIFAAHATENFEVVLGALNTTIKTVKAMGHDVTPYLESYKTVRASLGEAVRGVHITLHDAPVEARAAIKRELGSHRRVFTTSYDLLVYWAILHGDGPGKLKDCFWNTDCEFDPEDAKLASGATAVYFLHGALHLVVSGTGVTRKLKSTSTTLLDQFGKPITGDPQARPLLISEGASVDKLRAIESNAYLSHALRQLRTCRDPMVIFGSSLSDQDQHLVEAINEHPERPVAVSMRKSTPADMRKKQKHIGATLETKHLYFFDAATHPLGQPELHIDEDGPFWGGTFKQAA